MMLSLLLSLFLVQGPLPVFDTGVITGVVKQADGSPAAKVRVAAMPAGEAQVDAQNAAGTLVSLGQTDESGRYRLEGVPVGRYYVVAGRVNAPTFYPGVTEVSSAKAVAVTKGAEVSNIDFTVSTTSTQPERPFGNQPFGNNQFNLLQQFFSLQQLTQLQLKGRVVLDEASKGQKLPGSITLNFRMDNAKSPIPSVTGMIAGYSGSQRAQVAPDGTFTTNPYEGEATVSVTSLPTGYSVKSITAGGKDLTKVPLEIKQGTPEIVIVVSADLRPRFRVEGRVILPSGRDLFGEQIELVSESGATTRIILGINSSFAFINVLPGNYTLRIDSPTIGNLHRSITVADSEVNVELRP
jgi:hypothetical protein